MHYVPNYTGKIKTGEDIEVVGLVATQKTICTGKATNSTLCLYMHDVVMFVCVQCTVCMQSMRNIHRDSRDAHSLCMMLR